MGNFVAVPTIPPEQARRDMARQIYDDHIAGWRQVYPFAFAEERLADLQEAIAIWLRWHYTEEQILAFVDDYLDLRNREGMRRQAFLEQAQATAPDVTAPLWHTVPGGTTGVQRIPHQPIERPPRILYQNEEQEDPNMTLANRFLIGCDPEFAVLNGGRIVRAAEFVRNLDLNTEIGIDHNGRVMELRPAPAKSAYTLLRRIQRELKSDQLEPIRQFQWKGGAIATRDPFTTMGGHVHIDLAQLAKPQLQALDCVTRHLTDLDVLPYTEARDRQDRGEYGFYSDTRTTPGGEAGHHIEYRTMPSWLHDPSAAMLSLTGAKIAILAPDQTVELLHRKAPSHARMLRFYELFRNRDHDADRVLEHLTGFRPADPSEDMKARWETLPC